MTTRLKVAVACVVFLGVVALVWTHTWRSISMEGASDPERGVAFWMTSWKALDGTAIIDESGTTYASPEDARRDFEKELENGGAIIERSNESGGSSESDRRIVKLVGAPPSRDGAAEIIKLRGKQIQCVRAGRLKDALAFERAWFRI